MLIKYSFFAKASAVLAVGTALLFAVPAFAQTVDSGVKISFFERIGMFFSARKEKHLEKLKEFVSETVIEEPAVFPVAQPFSVNPIGIESPVDSASATLPLLGGEEKPQESVFQVQAAPVEPQKLAPVTDQKSLFQFLAQ